MITFGVANTNVKTALYKTLTKIVREMLQEMLGNMCFFSINIGKNDATNLYIPMGTFIFCSKGYRLKPPTRPTSPALSIHGFSRSEIPSGFGGGLRAGQRAEYRGGRVAAAPLGDAWCGRSDWLVVTGIWVYYGFIMI